MADVPTQVILAAFKDEEGADNALKQLKEAQKEHLIKVENVAVLRCDQHGKLSIKEPTDRGFAEGALIGGAVGAIVGVLFGPLVLATTAGGAALGGLVAKLHDSGFDDQRLRELGKNLQPGTSAIVAVIDHVWVAELEAELQKAGADTATQQLGADIAEQLKAGHDVAYTAIAAGDTAVIARATSAPETAAADGSKEALQPATGAGLPAASGSTDSPTPAPAAPTSAPADPPTASTPATASPPPSGASPQVSGTTPESGGKPEP
jgi:uncharacterized membrane protein